MTNETLTMADKELAKITAFAQGYINALLAHDNVYKGFDEFCSWGEEWDVNVHRCGKPRTIHVVAHPQTRGDDGYLKTDMTRWVCVGEWNMKGEQTKWGSE